MIATTPVAVTRLAPVCLALGATLWVPKDLVPKDLPVGEFGNREAESTASIQHLQANGQLLAYSQPLQTQLQLLWEQQGGLIFALATGAVVRLIAPLLTSKATDPAVVVLDPAGQVVISLCGGHQGGADQLTRQLATLLGATPILTGAAASLGRVPVDLLGQPFGWQRGSGDPTAVSAAVAAGQPVAVTQKAGSLLWQQHLPADHTFQFSIPQAPGSLPPESQLQVSAAPPAAQIVIGIHQTTDPEQPATAQPQVHWHPRVLWLGLGCERGTSAELLALAVEQTCAGFGLATAAIAGVGTITLKADEVGLVMLCQNRGWPLRCFAPDQLNQVSVPNPSAVVAKEVGTPSVAEAAALLAAGGAVEAYGGSGSDPSGDPPVGKLVVSKQVFRQPGQGAVTVAIALAEQEYTGRLGQGILMLSSSYLGPLPQTEQ